MQPKDVVLWRKGFGVDERGRVVRIAPTIRSGQPDREDSTEVVEIDLIDRAGTAVIAQNMLELVHRPDSEEDPREE